MLSDEQIDRYSRQIILTEVGGKGQERILRSTVALYGMGELAQWTAIYLARAGVGHLGLELSNPDPFTGTPDCKVHPISELEPTADDPRAIVVTEIPEPEKRQHLHSRIARWGCPVVWSHAGGDAAFMAAFGGSAPDAACMESVAVQLPCVPNTPTSDLQAATTLWAAGHTALATIRGLLFEEDRLGLLTFFNARDYLIETQRLQGRRGCPSCGG
jgi:molybdopterin/thiamine biosynthesis adenylyltransferase